MRKLKIVAGILGLCGAAFGLLLTVKGARSQSEYMAFLHSLQASNITKIEVYEQKNSEIGSLLSSVSSPPVLDAFARAANTVEPWTPNHPGIAKSYFIELYLSDGQKREFVFDIMGGPPDHTIYIWFASRFLSGIAYHGNGKSAAMFDWLKTQTPKTALEPPPTAR